MKLNEINLPFKKIALICAVISGIVFSTPLFSNVFEIKIHEKKRIDYELSNKSYLSAGLLANGHTTASIVHEGDFLVLYGDSAVNSFDLLSVTGNVGVLGTPQKVRPEAMIATNTTNGNFRISFITLTPINVPHAFIRIPISKTPATLTFNMIVNTTSQVITITTSNSVAPRISIDDVSSIQNIPFTTQIVSTEIIADSNFISFETELAYDITKLKYTGYSLNGTIAQGGTALIDAGTAGLLRIGVISGGTAFSGVGGLIKLNFIPISCENSQILLNKFKFNTTEITGLTAGTVSVIFDAQINVTDSYTKKGKNFFAGILTSALSANCAVDSFAFKLSYNSQHIRYVNYSLNGTINTATAIKVTNSIPGILEIKGSTTGTPFNGAGSILNMEFSPLTRGASELSIQNFYYNANPIDNLFHGTITSKLYGDIDDNGKIEIFDAALLLQYIVGKDTNPWGIALPWENWRMESGEVDSMDTITALDVSQIMEYAFNMITVFPVETHLKSFLADSSEVSVERINDFLVFKAKNAVTGFEILSKNGDESVILGTPQKSIDNWLMAFNMEQKNYKIALATAYPINSEHEILRIPITGFSESLSFNLRVNNKLQTVAVKTETAPKINFENELLTLYPNPVKDELSIKFSINKKQNVSLNIYDCTGKRREKVFEGEMPAGEHTLIWKSLSYPAGIYFIEFMNENSRISKKVVKL